MNELDEIMSGAGETVSASTEPMTTEAPAPVEPAGGPIRDESGRFASQQQPQDGAGAVSTDQPVAEPHLDAKGVPVAALQAEREKARTARDEAEALRREIAELRGMVTAQRQPAQPQAAAEQKPEPTIWDNPDEFVRGQLNPVQQELRQTREMLLEMQASQEHGAEAVAAAKEAAKALFNTPEGAALAAKPGNLFSNIVAWHKQQQTFAKVGNDPDAWLQAELEKRMADPNFQAQVIERARSGASAVPGRTAAPITSLPPSLSRMPGGANAAADNDTSDAALFSNALR